VCVRVCVCVCVCVSHSCAALKRQKTAFLHPGAIWEPARLSKSALGHNLSSLRPRGSHTLSSRACSYANALIIYPDTNIPLLCESLKGSRRVRSGFLRLCVHESSYLQHECHFSCHLYAKNSFCVYMVRIFSVHMIRTLRHIIATHELPTPLPPKPTQGVFSE